MLCHFGHSGPLNNKGAEGNNGGYKSFVLGTAGAKNAVDSRFEQRRRTATPTAKNARHQRLGTSVYLLRMPSIQPFGVKKMEKLHPFVLANLSPDVNTDCSWLAEEYCRILHTNLGTRARSFPKTFNVKFLLRLLSQ